MLIAVDGIDGSGKGTQTKLIHQYLLERGKTVDLVSFPQYKSFFGTMVGEYLNGGFGSLEQVDPKLASLLYAMDRKAYFESIPLKGDITLCDRYVPSNIGHQASRVDPDKSEAFCNWLEELEFGVNRIPRPDISIIFDISVENSAKQVAKKKKREYTDLSHDIHEQDKVYLQKVRNYFLSLGDREAYHLVDCEDGKGNVLPIETIFEKVKTLVDACLV